MNTYNNWFFATILFCFILIACENQRQDQPVSSEVLSSYQVYSGDGFSFRYPSNWEVGTPQLRTTRVLVRAKPEEAGYAASCNVNASEIEGIADISQQKLDSLNHKLHDRAYFESTVLSAMPEAKITSINKHSSLSMQPATVVEFTANIRGPQIDTTNKFYQAVTFRKPHRYVVGCRSFPEHYAEAKPSFDMIMNTLYFE